MAVLVETTLGDLVIDLFVKERPNSCHNFLKLCKMKYFNLCQFHTIEKNYLVQTGDPTGTGRGGESIFGVLYGEQARYFEREELPKLRHTRTGLVSFVNNGNNEHGSQFFITLGSDNLDYLDQQHTIFGQVTEGLDTLEKLNDEEVNDELMPFKDIRISHTIILDDPFGDPPQFEVPERSPSPTFEQLVTPNKIALDQKVNEDEGKTAEEIEEEMKKKEMIEQAHILEMVGDLRSADERPPDNVLFVCKLNPVTNDEDLEIIFSRFGKILSCEVIRDRRSQQSLQYGFIEFEDAKSCESAFFKMDNVIIDDRRIHVDFSQSVAKNYTWNRGGKEQPKKEVKTENKSPVRGKREQRSRSRERRRESPPRRNRESDDRPRYSNDRRRDDSQRGNGRHREDERRRRDESPKRWNRRDRSDSGDRRRKRSRSRDGDKKTRRRSPSPRRRDSRSPRRKHRR